VNCPTHHQSSGTALVAVIWLIAILGLAALVTTRVVSFDMQVASAKIHGFRAKQLAEMGIAVGSNPAVKRTDPLLNRGDDETGEGFKVKILSEGARFNLNAILLRDDKALLRSMFTDWGLDLDAAQSISDAMSDWIDPDDELALNGAEKEWYEKEGRTNQPFNRPFYSLDEVRLVRGMDQVEAVKPDWRNWFTIWSSGGLDANEASAELIAAAAEVTVDTADQVVEQVRGPDGIRDTEDDAPFKSVNEVLTLLGVDTKVRPDILQRFSVNDTTVRVESIGSAEGAKRKIIVTLRNRTGRPAILERSEEVIP
jgi:type II secretory pathway component PulK